MGSKNRIFLGVITQVILHYIRNKFDNKDLYITKTKYNKIKIDHPIEHINLNNIDFQKFIDGTVGYCMYQKYQNIYNFVSIVDNNYHIYSISINNHYLEVATFFRASAKRLKKCIKEDIQFFSENNKSDFIKYIN
ncbi:MAG: hypothetical protein DRG78_22215 [Epsilonproteobacteria bacterium]|nr:MAG: hypothetical protein DRG78_22215 [Campylobacterota bacterium]